MRRVENMLSEEHGYSHRAAQLHQNSHSIDEPSSPQMPNTKNEAIAVNRGENLDVELIHLSNSLLAGTPTR